MRTITSVLTFVFVVGCGAPMYRLEGNLRPGMVQKSPARVPFSGMVQKYLPQGSHLNMEQKNTVRVPFTGMVEKFHAGGPMRGMTTEKKLDHTPHSRGIVTIEGRLVRIDGEFYVLEHLTSGKQFRLHVDGYTAFLTGEKKPGDMITAWVKEDNGRTITIR